MKTNLNNFLAVQNLKMALKKQKFHNILLKTFSADTLPSLKRQNEGPKEDDGRYMPNCGSKQANFD